MRPLVSMSGRPGALSPTRRRRSLLACRLASREYEQEHTDGDKSTDGVRMDRGAPAGNGGATLTAPAVRHLHGVAADGSGKRNALWPARRRRSPLVCSPACGGVQYVP